MLMNVANFSVLIYSVGLIRSDIATRQLNFNSIKYYYTNGVKRPRPLFFAARQLIATWSLIIHGHIIQPVIVV